MTSRFASLTKQDIEKIVEDKDHFFFVEFLIKQLLDSVFVISRIIKVSVRVINLSLWLRLITPTSTLIILDITNTSSNNCLLFCGGLGRYKRIENGKKIGRYSHILM